MFSLCTATIDGTPCKQEIEDFYPMNRCAYWWAHDCECGRPRMWETTRVAKNYPLAIRPYCMECARERIAR